MQNHPFKFPKIGIRPTIDGRLGGVRESLEDSTMAMAQSLADLYTANLRNLDGSHVECVIADTNIGGVREAAACEEKFQREGVGLSVTVTPCWCYGSETMDMDPHRPKAVWGFNGTERPGAVYLAAALAGHTQKGLPAFGIYGKDVQEAGDTNIPADVVDKLLNFARAGLAVAYMRGKAYLSMGGTSMGIAGSVVDPAFWENHLGMRLEAIDFLKRETERPFFLHLTYNAPHSPLQAPEEDRAPFADREDLNEAVKTFYVMVRNLDRNIGRLLETVDRLKLRDNTLIIFSSDNGPQFGDDEGGSLDRFNCNLHGSKGSTYEGGIRVPAIVRWPDGLDPACAKTDAFFHMSDWFPTLLSLAGIECPTHLKLDGIDQSNILRGEPSPHNPARAWQWNRYTPRLEYNAALRDGDWKLVRPYVPEAFHVPDIQWLEVSMYQPEHFIKNGIITDPDPEVQLPPPPPLELYNLADDPGETNNLAAAQPDRLRRMENQLHHWFEDVTRDLARTRRD